MAWLQQMTAPPILQHLCVAWSAALVRPPTAAALQQTQTRVRKRLSTQDAPSGSCVEHDSP